MSIEYQPKITSKSRKPHYPNYIYIDEAEIDITNKKDVAKNITLETDSLIYHHDPIHVFTQQIFDDLKQQGVDVPDYEPFSPLDEVLTGVLQLVVNTNKTMVLTENGFANQYVLIEKQSVIPVVTAILYENIPLINAFYLDEDAKKTLVENYIGDITMASVFGSDEDFREKLLSLYSEDEINNLSYSDWYNIIKSIVEGTATGHFAPLAVLIQQTGCTLELDFVEKAKQGIEQVNDYILHNLEFPVHIHGDTLYIPLVYQDKASLIGNAFNASKSAEQTQNIISELEVKPDTGVKLANEWKSFRSSFDQSKSRIENIKKKRARLQYVLDMMDSANPAFEKVSQKLDSVYDSLSLAVHENQEIEKNMQDFVDAHIEDMDIPMGLSIIDKIR
jgi:hypothetical protein